MFIAFIGKDEKGDYCTSAGKRISRFRQYSLGDFTDQSVNLFDD